MSLGTVVPASQAQPGDLVYYANGGLGFAHIAVYAGNGQAIHGGWNGNQTVVTVSYTHLSFSSCYYYHSRGIRNNRSIVPVSYTHLDVYKRQDYSFNITTFFVRIVQKVIFYNIICSTLKYVLYLMVQCIRIDKTHITHTIRSR